MTIEEEIFRKAKIDFTKIFAYGFKRDKPLYKYSKNIMNNTFRVDIEIHQDGIVRANGDRRFIKTRWILSCLSYE